jgi:hypothetical protein
MLNKNKIIKQLLLITIVLFTLGACKKDKTEEHAKKLLFTGKIDAAPTIKTDETIVLNPKLLGEGIIYSWVEDGKVIGTNAAYVFQRDVPGDYVITLNVSNVNGTNSITYKIKVIGVYLDRILLINSTGENGTGGGNISSLDTANLSVKLNAFSQENNGAKLSTAAMGAFRYTNQLYVSGSSSPYIQVINDETLKLETTSITTASPSLISYFATIDGKTGFVNAGSGSRRGFYAVDLTAKTIGTTLLSGTASAALLPITVFGNAYLTPVAKKLVKVENGTAQDLFTYTENVAGVVKTADKQIWVGVSRGSNVSGKAKFIRLDENFAVQETVELESTFLLPPNGILTSSLGSKYIYWQETATGDFCRFNTATKTAEKFVSPAANGLVFATAWKVNPKNGDLYIADSPGLFSGLDSNSDLYIYDVDKTLRKKIAKVGYQVVAIVFPK